MSDSNKTSNKLTINEFRALGQEQNYVKHCHVTRYFTALFGSLGIHSRIRAGHVVKVVQALCLPPKASILDAGCGHALALFWLARHYPSYTCHGLEIDSELVEDNHKIARELQIPSMTFERADLEKCDATRKNYYDLIISIDVLEHVKEDINVLVLLRRLLKPAGTLVLHLPLRHQLQKRIIPLFKDHVIDDHVRDEYLLPEITEKLATAGFQVITTHYGFSWQGELAFELNNLFWSNRILRFLSAMLTYPISWYLAYLDVNIESSQGNSLIVVAVPIDSGKVD
jgi:2-polyprenyl-3-methyl-5-hydroxy-6-metoxy-1,4-benzoquinol methylase